MPGISQGGGRWDLGERGNSGNGSLKHCAVNAVASGRRRRWEEKEGPPHPSLYQGRRAHGVQAAAAA